MVDHAIVVTVTPDPDSTTEKFIFAYSDNGRTPSTDGSVTVPAAASKTFLVSIMANGKPDDTCVFSTSPLLVQRGGTTLSSPEWLEGLAGGGSSVLSFTDHNINQLTTDYIIFINAIYNETPITSPDPTIVNDGIDHIIERSSQDRPKPLASAV